MEDAVSYLNAIDEINRAERQIRMRGANGSRLARLTAAYAAAEAAWASVEPSRRALMAPPPRSPP